MHVDGLIKSKHKLRKSNVILLINKKATKVLHAKTNAAPCIKLRGTLQDFVTEGDKIHSFDYQSS